MLDELTGYEFENLVATLLEKIGFEVMQTPLSHDGGIDLIATLNQPFVSGKYLVQCKRYSGKIGEPFVRDLYGVVASQNANKGILVTNSEFSDDAIRFAEGKNLELIDGKILLQQLSKYNVLSAEKGPLKIPFQELPDFDNGKYQFLLKYLAENKKNFLAHEKLFLFLYSYLANGDERYINSDLPAVCIDILRKMGKGFWGSKWGNIARDCRVYSLFYPFLYLCTGELEKAVERSVLPIVRWMRKKTIDEFEPQHYTKLGGLESITYEKLGDPIKGRIQKIDNSSEESEYLVPFASAVYSFEDYTELYNLYSVFRKYKYIQGLKYIKALYEKNREEKQEDVIDEQNYQLCKRAQRKIEISSQQKIYIPQHSAAIGGLCKTKIFTMDHYIELDKIEALKFSEEQRQKVFQEITYLLELK